DLDPDLRALLLAARDRARERLDALGPANELIHGDLVPDNVLTADAAIRVIDFDDCGWSWFGFELATSLFPLRLLGGFEPALAGYLEGYRAVRAFPQHQLEELPTLLVARGLSYLGWTVGRPEIAAQRPLVPFLAHAMGEMARDDVADPGRSSFLIAIPLSRFRRSRRDFRTRTRGCPNGRRARRIRPRAAKSGRSGPSASRSARQLPASPTAEGLASRARVSDSTAASR